MTKSIVIASINRPCRFYGTNAKVVLSRQNCERIVADINRACNHPPRMPSESSILAIKAPAASIWGTPVTIGTVLSAKLEKYDVVITFTLNCTVTDVRPIVQLSGMGSSERITPPLGGNKNLHHIHNFSLNAIYLDYGATTNSNV